MNLLLWLLAQESLGQSVAQFVEGSDLIFVDPDDEIFLVVMWSLQLRMEFLEKS